MGDNYDVVVVGAGPAGSTAAKFAAQEGARVLLLEKHPVIGHPLCCAEAISTTGLSRVVEPDPRWICSKIERVRLFAPDNSTAVIYHPQAGYILERKLFDRALAEQAADSGAEIRVGVDVVDMIPKSNSGYSGILTIENNNPHEIHAKVIIAADGIESQVAVKAGMPALAKPSQLHSACQYLLGGIEIEPGTVEFHIGNKISPGGYAWVFHKRPGVANVGVGVCPTKTPHKKAIDYLNEFARKRFGRYQILEKMTGAVPTYLEKLPLCKNNLLLCGDAARVVDSFTGAGIANALLSGKLAGQTAAAMVKDGVKGDLYEEEFRKLKERELKFYKLCRQVFLKLTDDDMVACVKFAADVYDDRRVEAINPFEVVKKAILSHPRLLTLGRHLLTG